MQTFKNNPADKQTNRRGGESKSIPVSEWRGQRSHNDLIGWFFFFFLFLVVFKLSVFCLGWITPWKSLVSSSAGRSSPCLLFLLFDYSTEDGCWKSEGLSLIVVALLLYCPQKTTPKKPPKNKRMTPSSSPPPPPSCGNPFCSWEGETKARPALHGFM